MKKYICIKTFATDNDVFICGNVYSFMDQTIENILMGEIRLYDEYFF